MPKAKTSNGLVIYTDGACSGNPGPGGWGVLMQFGSKEKTLKGGEPDTTNNRMEMMAAIKALEAIKPEVIAAGNIGCMMQIGSGTGIPVVHTVELLDWATGGPKPKKLTQI